MNAKKRTALILISVASAVLVAAPAIAQTITGTPGSPSATTTIDGKQLPPPPAKFGGVIKESAKDSKPYWPPTVVPPKGAPNVLLIMTDDQGYGVSGTFGGVIPTPAHGPHRQGGAALHAVPLHRALLADAGGADHRPQPPLGRLRRHRRNVHRLPGLRLGHRARERHDRQPSSRTTDTPRRGSARTTTRRPISTARPDLSISGRSAWASNTSTGSWAARPTSGRRTCSRTPRPSSRGSARQDYNLTTDMADEAIKYMSSLNAAAPEKPFFVYYVPGGTHSPHQPKKEWIDKFKGKFDMGYEKLREQIFANQKRLGVIPANTQLTPWPADLPKWDSLSLVRKKLYAREAEVFAGYVAYTDHEIGRVIQAVEDMGKLDNTLIIYISGDNGTSAEGTLEGTPNQMTAYNAILNLPEVEQSCGITKPGARTRPIRTCRWRGRGRSIRRSNGRSRWPRTSAAPGRAWSSRGPVTSRTSAASARSSIT